MTLSRVVNFGELELLRGVGGSQSPQNILDVVLHSALPVKGTFQIKYSEGTLMKEEECCMFVTTPLLLIVGG